MFDLISPSEHDSSKERISAFLKHLKSYNLDLYRSIQLKSDVTYILAIENTDRIQGGALLFQQKVSSLHPQIRKKLKDNVSLNQTVWSGTLYLHFGDEIEGHTFESLCKVFYQNLYESLIAFGVEKQTSFLCLTLDSCEHLSTEFIGLWPYKVQIRHRESQDGLFHGVLSLIGNQNKLRDAA